MNYLVPDNGPFFLPGGSIGCILLHGFSSMPGEMRPLGDYLSEKGYTVLGIRFSGHATHPADLKHARWTDWLEDVEDGLGVLSRVCSKQVLIGQSMGAMIALTAAAQMEVAGVVGLSTPFEVRPIERTMDWILGHLPLTIRNKTPRFPPEDPLYHRRELNYPAYPEHPARILPELDRLATAMLAALPQVKSPVLLVQSRDDQAVPFESMQSIYDRLRSPHKQMLAVEGMDHSLVMDAQRHEVFEAVARFLEEVMGQDQAAT